MRCILGRRVDPCSMDGVMVLQQPPVLSSLRSQSRIPMQATSQFLLSYSLAGVYIYFNLLENEEETRTCSTERQARFEIR